MSLTQRSSEQLKRSGRRTKTTKIIPVTYNIWLVVLASSRTKLNFQMKFVGNVSNAFQTIDIFTWRRREQRMALWIEHSHTDAGKWAPTHAHTHRPTFQFRSYGRIYVCPMVSNVFYCCYNEERKMTVFTLPHFDCMAAYSATIEETKLRSFISQLPFSGAQNNRIDSHRWLNICFFPARLKMSH